MHASAAYDMSKVKAFESVRNLEVFVRLGVVAACVIILVIGYGQPALPLFPFLGAYLISSLAVLAYAAWLPETASPRQALGLTALYSVEASAYAALPFWLWVQPASELQTFALFLIFAAMLQSVAFAAMPRERRLVAAVFLGAGVVALLALRWLHGEDMMALATWAFGLSALYGYYLFSICQVFANERHVHALTQRQISRERLAAVGDLTGGVAHDFNNLLTVILGNLELARAADDPGERLLLLNEAYEAGQRGARLTSHLLSFSGKSFLRPERVNLAELIRRNLDFTVQIVPPDIKVTLTDTRDDLPDVLLDIGKFETMLLNFVLNARDAMPNGGALVIGLASEDRGRMVRLTLTDSGEGMSPETMARATEPFFTTKPVGQGTGLGLSMAKGFVEQSGGRLEVTSRVGKGTTILVRLPAAPAAEATLLQTPAVAT